MPRITIEKHQQIGPIRKVVTETYILDEYIRCPKGDSIMGYDSHHRAYVCRSCGEEITAQQYIESILSKNNDSFERE